jgi:hypothetical protein
MVLDTIDLVSLLPYLIPLLAVEFGLKIWALVALFKPKTPPRHLNRWVWFAIILCVNTIGPILFLVIGRSQDE